VQRNYDYIITGGGCAGLSLLFRLHKDPFFNNKKILVIDAAEKNQHDRTWCFWENGKGLFEEIVYHKWDIIEFIGIDASIQSCILPYQYKMIRGIDYYRHIQDSVKGNNNIHWLQEQVNCIYTDPNGFATVVLKDDKKIKANYIFNSIIFEKPIPQKNQYYFLQHFVGWEIETTKACFDPLVARFMDFSIPQEYGTSFMYVLPVSDRKALFEYTLFTENLLTEEQYNQRLASYIASRFKIEDYQITHIEKGVIPMTNIRFPQQTQCIINIGIAGNQAKASSGYAFQFIQKRTNHIIATLKNDLNTFSYESFNDKKASIYDATLLRVLKEGNLSGASIFTDIFKNNRTQNIFSFLDNESSLFTDLKIMNSVPTKIFLPAAIKQMLSAI
jgi:lycopene beta-cyclase